MVKYLTERKGSHCCLTAPAIRGGYCTLAAASGRGLSARFLSDWQSQGVTAGAQLRTEGRGEGF